MSEATATAPVTAAQSVPAPAAARASTSSAPPVKTVAPPEGLRCRLISDHHADPSKATPEEKAQIRFWFVEKMDPERGKIKVPVPYYPAGTVFVRDVIGFIMRGMAVPDNPETAAACGLSEAELHDKQHRYARIKAGIDPADFELYDAGVIVGYDKDGDYRPGPYWDNYMKSREDEAKKAATEI